MSSHGGNHNFLKKIPLIGKQKTFRVLVLGQNGVGKTALTVRFLTGRYIGEYDPTLERVYACSRPVRGVPVHYEVLDTVARQTGKDHLEDKIRWADAVLLLYAVTDRCSFNECSRLKFLINAKSAKRKRRSTDLKTEVTSGNCPVVLVATQSDRDLERMVDEGEGRKRALELGCCAFHEVSSRENPDEVFKVFEDLYMQYRRWKTVKVGVSVSLLSLDRLEESSDDDFSISPPNLASPVTSPGRQRRGAIAVARADNSHRTMEDLLLERRGGISLAGAGDSSRLPVATLPQRRKSPFSLNRGDDSPSPQSSPSSQRRRGGLSASGDENTSGRGAQLRRLSGLLFNAGAGSPPKESSLQRRKAITSMVLDVPPPSGL